ncbi:hypothetical protein [Pseudomonas sp. NFACC37-1]|uniref:hypothetical protein n=1 Tax=Pseudomonas sp. NFACC37-1 TaxID=1566196 RepID=UPI00088EE6F9|nr:hypothetical protein [Pseudomonas sp. NFACC37-1]SCZ12639.1 hypothetical protein SAMN03159391_05722 [Pseudomonas sp. NFACC37-1]
MSIPANALKEDELFHYASLDPDAADELARRIASGDIDPNAGLEELREDIRMLESQADDAEDEANLLRTYMSDASDLIRRAMDPEEKQFSVNELLKEALDRLE